MENKLYAHTAEQKRLINQIKNSGLTHKYICGEINISRSHLSKVFKEKHVFTDKLTTLLVNFMKNKLADFV